MNRKPRNIVKVIEAIKKEITNPNLIRILDRIAESAGYQAPEIMQQSWLELVNVLNNYVPLDSKEGPKISAIMRDEIDVGARS